VLYTGAESLTRTEWECSGSGDSSPKMRRVVLIIDSSLTTTAAVDCDSSVVDTSSSVMVVNWVGELLIEW